MAFNVTTYTAVTYKTQYVLCRKGATEGSKKDGPFFLFCYIDDKIVVARGRGGGLALWYAHLPLHIIHTSQVVSACLLHHCAVHCQILSPHPETFRFMFVHGQKSPINLILISITVPAKLQLTPVYRVLSGMCLSITYALLHPVQHACKGPDFAAGLL